MKTGLYDFIMTIIIFLVFFLIGLVFLVNQWWITGAIFIFTSMAPLESFYHDNS